MKTYRVHFKEKLGPGITYYRYVYVNARNKFFAVIKARIETGIYNLRCTIEVTEER